ncbi:MAG: restriction endonuclease subunit S [Spirochaetes bacterium]|nr:restriction endonuclease subunit S [Spirochaetota bacterium]
MSGNWPIKTIDDLKAPIQGSIAVGPFGSRMKSDCYVDFGIPVIRGTNITGGPAFEGEFVYITKEKADTLGSSNVYKGDLVFPHRGAIGEVGIVRNDSHYVLSSSLMKLTPDAKIADSLFLYYFFKSQVGKHELLKNASQVGTPGIGQPLTSLKQIELKLPPLSIQQQIAKILGDLDDKIAINNQINQTLEAMAQALFKSWFVDFDPVKAKMKARAEGGNDDDVSRAAMAVIAGKSGDDLKQFEQKNPEEFAKLAETADLFPERLVESVLGEIPEGWEVKTVGEVSMFSDKRISVNQLNLENYVSTENMLPYKCGITNASSLPTTPTTPLFESGQILVSNIRPYFQKIWLATFSGGRSNDVLGFVPKIKGISEFLFNLMYQDSFFEFMMTTSKGAKMPRGDKDAIMKYQIVFDKNIAIHFSKKVKAINELYAEHIVEIKILSETRDTLMPRLLSGEIDLSSFGDEVGE